MNQVSPLIALLVTVLFLSVLVSRFGKTVQDIPNERSLHSVPVPRTGGIALMLGVSAGWSFLAESIPWWLWLPCLLLFVVSLLDDIRNLPVKQRLFAHLAAAALLVAGSGVVMQQGWLVALAVFCFAAWMIDLYNFMDGSDGLAGGMALFGFGFYGIASLLAHDVMLALLNFSVACAALGFLFFNFHPARIFMGDAGSIPLGFLAAAQGLWGWLRGDWSAWFPLLVFSPFIADATVTLVKRTLRGAKITEAHREHYYQRAVQLGYGHRKVALLGYGLMIVTGLAALYARNAPFPVPALLLSAAVLMLPMWFIERHWQKKDLR